MLWFPCILILFTTEHHMDLIQREELVQAYINQVIDNMNTKDLVRIVWEQLEENLKGYSDQELLTEIEDYYPELLEGVEL